MHGWRWHSEDGYTLVEVMLAMAILLAGIMGTIKLIDVANGTTVKTRTRELANNLAREVTERARVVDYDTLTATGTKASLQGTPALADSTPLTSDWTIKRGNATFTIATSSCIYDDAKDGVAATHGATICSNSPAAGSTTTVDVNPDDFRRIDLTMTWKAAATTGSLKHSTLIINPSGGLGPRINSFLPSGSSVPTITVSSSTATSLNFNVSTSTSDAVRWAADDAVSFGNATGGPGSWAFSWGLGTALDTNAAYVGDGTYQVTAQAFDGVGIPGDLRVVTVIVNRSRAVAPTGFSGGRNARFSTGSIVDLDWRPNPERDVKGYRVYRVGPDGVAETSDDPLVCNDVLTTSCADMSPPAINLTYYVKAVDLDSAGNKRTGPRSALLPVPATAGDAPTFNGGASLSATIENGLPRLTWTSASGSIRFYRIYRDSGTGFADRYARTESSSPAYTDAAPGATTAHKYWVTAVDDSYNESAPLGPVTSP